MWFPRLRRDKKALAAATTALGDAQRARGDIETHADVVARLSEAVHEHVHRNHFAERLEGIIIRPGRGFRDDS